MRNLEIYLSALAVLHGVAALGHGSSHFRDLQAFPKFEVQFLNQLPISESDAKRCMSAGIEREDEWMGLRAPHVDQKRLGSGEEIVPTDDRLDLIRMALAPPGADTASPYLCLMPHANTTASQVQPTEEPEVAIDPVSSWAALSHLDGKCLYTRQGWFTYSYCHNQHIRQFRAAPHAHPHPPGGYIPTEDPKQDAYTLGRVRHAEGGKQGISDGRPRQHGQKQAKSGQAIERAKAASPAKQAPQPANDNLAGQGDNTPSTGDSALPPHASSITSSTLGAPSRYLVQRWSDGTLCDKSGRPRETEIQIHCDASTTDRIYQIKELAVCSYLVIIHSPHLCALPGFKAPTDDVQPAAIRCRRVLGDEEFEEWATQAKEEEARWYGGQPEGERTLEGFTGGAGVWPDLRPQGLERHHTPLIEPPSPPAEEADTGPSLKELLLQALQRKAEADKFNDPSSHHGPVPPANTETEPEVEEVMFISLEQDEDGQTAMYVESGGDAQDAVQNIPDEQRELLMNAVRDFLAQGDKAKEKGKKGGKGEEKKEGAGQVKDEL